MMETIEKEIKLLLSEKKFGILYNYLEKRFGVQKKYIHVNYYIDTPTYFLKRQGISVRIRQHESSIYEFTIKKNLSRGNRVSIKKENNHLLNQIEAKKILEDGINDDDIFIFNILSKYLVSPLEEPLIILGNLTTTRTEFLVSHLVEPIILDHSCYLEQEDYELEWETEDIDVAIQHMTRILNEVDINERPLLKSKSSRFYQAYKCECETS